MRARFCFFSVIGLLFLISASGCFSSRARDIAAFLKPAEVNTSDDTYILQPPDDIEIHCSKVPEIHLQRQQIRPDGVVTFENLGDIPVAGKTPRQVTELVREKASQLYTLSGDYPVDVRIVAYRSHRYYVLGEVYYRGSKICTGRDTVLSALAEARPTTLAWKDMVQVIRPSSDKKKKPKIFKVNYKKMVVHGDTSKNVLLQEGDIVYVPPTILAAISMVIEEAVRPIGRAFSTVNIVQGPGGGN